jgi:hypothetical protein
MRKMSGIRGEEEEQPARRSAGRLVSLVGADVMVRLGTYIVI